MNLSNIDLNLLKVFESLYIERSVTKAAQRLGVAQSSLSSSLKRLRELFGDPLFSRVAGKMEPSQRAKELEPVITQCLSDVRDLMITPPDFDPKESNKVFTIAGSDFTAFTILPRLLSHLSVHAPGIRLIMKPLLSDEIANHLISNQVDLAICSGKFKSSQILSKPLFSEDMMVITSQSHEASTIKTQHAKNAIHGKMTLKEYASLKHIYITSKGDGEKIIDRALKKRGLHRKIGLTVQNFLVVPYIVENSELVATVSERVAYQCSQRSKLHIYPFPAKVDKNTFNIVWNKSNNSADTHWMIQTIDQLMS